MASKKTSDGLPRVSIEPTEGTKLTLISPNWCDKTTWYMSSVRELGTTLTGNAQRTEYTGTGIWVDNYHGRYSDEDTLKTDEGFVPRLKVYVDGVQKVEVDPHTNAGDYLVDYMGAKVTFSSPLSEGAVVTADVYKVQNSVWRVLPSAGKHLKIVLVEAQFSLDVHVTDSILFQPYGYVDVFAPQLMPGVPSGTKIPLGPPKKYKTMMDYVNEATGALPLIKSPSGGTNTWRDITCDMQVFPWNYIAVTELSSAAGMEVRISLEHNVPFGGTAATASLYCLSDVEE
jgi:hypothetical protein